MKSYNESDSENDSNGNNQSDSNGNNQSENSVYWCFDEASEYNVDKANNENNETEIIEAEEVDTGKIDWDW